MSVAVCSQGDQDSEADVCPRSPILPCPHPLLGLCPVCACSCHLWNVDVEGEASGPCEKMTVTRALVASVLRLKPDPLGVYEVLAVVPWD